VDESFFGTDQTATIADLFTASGGSDEANGATSGYSLVATGGVDTGLIDTATNTAIRLVQVDATHVEGRAGTSVVFEVSLSGSTLKLDQRLAIEHPLSNPDDPNQAISISSTLANLLKIQGTLVDKDGDAATPVSINIADKLTFLDDGPTIDQTISGGSVAFVAGQHLTDTSITSSVGGDLSATGLQIINTYTNLPNVTEVLSEDGKTLQYSNTSGDLFKLSLTDSGYDFLVQQTQQNVTRTLDFGAISAGGPRETIPVPTTDGVDTVTFDGLIFKDPVSDPRAAIHNPGAASTNDDTNPDSLGFGIKAGQASQMNDNEGFVADLDGTVKEFSDFSFAMQGIGSNKSVQVTYWTVDVEATGTTLSDPTVLNYGPGTTLGPLPSGQGKATVHIPTPEGVDQIYVKFDYFKADGTADTNVGVRLLDFTETQKSTFSAVDLTFGSSWTTTTPTRRFQTPSRSMLIQGWLSSSETIDKTVAGSVSPPTLVTY
jgi:hypothetical protein